ncbi:hypothetical protein A2223_04710 [Candidatus Falkowbacteria bacterium RIFOXYA2_FULL_35_8]|nr:MAG: hypothetical protein A2223_04710 [Candidatus Falkowbacteria bacterium RIFOXYA2_FULL_35_8]
MGSIPTHRAKRQKIPFGDFLLFSSDGSNATACIALGIEDRSDVLRRRLASKTARGGLRKIFRKKNLFVGDSTHSTVKRGGGRRWPDKIFGRKF